MSYIPLVNISGATVRTLRAHKLDTSNREATRAAPDKSHLILVIDQSGSMYSSMQEMRATLTKLLALEEYVNDSLLVSLVSYSGKGETYLRIEREPIASVMSPRGSGPTAIESLRATNLTCISGALKVARSLTRAGEATTIVLHSDGYANDPSPYAETTSIADVLSDLSEESVMLSTVSYGNADFALLDMIASKGGGVCVQARGAGQVFDALHAASKPAASVDPAVTVTGANGATLVGYSKSARRVFSGIGEIMIRGLKADDDLEVWECTDAANDFDAVQTLGEAFAFPVAALLYARAALSAGNINAAKQAVLGARVESLYPHLRALTSPQIGAFASALDAAIFGDTPLVFAKESGIKTSAVTVLEVLEVLRQHAGQYLINVPMLTEGRQRRSIARKSGSLVDGALVPPDFTTRLKDASPWARVGAIEMSRTAATINVNITRPCDLVGPAGEVIREVAGVPLDLADYRNITIVGEGSVLAPDLHIKVTDKRLSKRLTDLGFAPVAGVARIPLAELSVVRPDLTGDDIVADTTLFERFTACAIARRILDAALEGESVKYDAATVTEFAAHCLSKSGYYNPPTVNPYEDRAAAISAGEIDSYTTYRIELGSTALFATVDLPSANAFLDRRFTCMTTGDTVAQPIDKPTMNAVVTGAASVTLKPATAIKRLKMGPADTIMLPWFLAFFDHTDEDGFHEGRGQWSGLLSAAGVDPEDIEVIISGGLFERAPDARIVLLTSLRDAVSTYEDLLYSQTLAPVVMFAGATGFLPEGIAGATTAHSAEGLEAAYPGLKVPSKKRDAMFSTFADGRFIAVRPESVWYSTQ